LAEFDHSTTITSSSVAVYKEVINEDAPDQTHFVLQQTPFNPPSVRPPVNQPNPKLGVSIALWSFDSRYLVTRNGMLLQ
jgi:hypothetical protein